MLLCNFNTVADLLADDVRRKLFHQFCLSCCTKVPNVDSHSIVQRPRMASQCFHQYFLSLRDPDNKVVWATPRVKCDTYLSSAPKEVIPVMPEPIIKQDGQTKNDCERNASKRFLNKFRADHPYLKVIIIEDGLASNAPHIREIKSHKMHSVLGAKQSDHAFLFAHIEKSEEENLVGHCTIVSHVERAGLAISATIIII